MRTLTKASLRYLKVSSVNQTLVSERMLICSYHPNVILAEGIAVMKWTISQKPYCNSEAGDMQEPHLEKQGFNLPD